MARCMAFLLSPPWEVSGLDAVSVLAAEYGQALDLGEEYAEKRGRNGMLD